MLGRLLLCVALTYQVGRAEEPPEPVVVLSSKVAADGDFLTVPVRVAGELRSFMIDTGTPVTVFHAPFVKGLQRADEATRAKVPLQHLIAELYQPPKMIVSGTESGAIEFPADCAIRHDDLSKYRVASNHGIDGVLGMDFLEPYALELDLSAGTLRLLKSESVRTKGHDAALAIDMIRRRPCVQIGSGTAEFWALVDTGALLTLDIHNPTYKYLLERDEITRWPIQTEVAGKQEIKYSHEGFLHELVVGPFKHRALTVDSDDSVSLLGLYYWRRYRCIFDFPRNRIYLDKGPLYNVFDDSGHAGLYFEPDPDDEKVKVIKHIVKGTWAERLGILSGDRLVQVNGQAVEKDSQHNLYRRLSFRHDRTCELRLVRDGKEFTITLPATGSVPQ